MIAGKEIEDMTDTNIAGKEIEDMLINPLELIYSNEDPATYLQCNGSRTTPDLLLASSDITTSVSIHAVFPLGFKRHQRAYTPHDDPGSGHKPVIASEATSYYHRLQKHELVNSHVIASITIGSKSISKAQNKDDPGSGHKPVIASEATSVSIFLLASSDISEHTRDLLLASSDISEHTRRISSWLQATSASIHAALIDDPGYGPIATPCELSATIKQLKCKKSPGEAGIHPEFLIRMGPKAKETMLTKKSRRPVSYLTNGKLP
ncbi:unnamed protein product [Rodentolepis nana]|uniref:Uncharacterized protein n=1 Tax=Rodentolepis nana TaxID=102285 RepID=A0A3P7RKW7_RODNA|nr:unnamed protein product [Rodentolepis nana]